MEIIIQLLFFGTLLWNAITDIRKKEWPCPAMIIFVMGGIASLFIQKVTLTDLTLRLLPGLLLFACGMVFRDKIGLGDGLIVSIGGLYFTEHQIWRWIILAFGISGLVGLLIVCIKKQAVTKQIAFIPFLFIAAVVEEFLC